MMNKEEAKRYIERMAYERRLEYARKHPKKNEYYRQMVKELEGKSKKEYMSRTSPKTGIRWTWFGGHEIHGYLGKKEIAFASIGGFSNDKITEQKARKALERFANLSVEEQSSYLGEEEDRKRLRV